MTTRELWVLVRLNLHSLRPAKLVSFPAPKNTIEAMALKQRKRFKGNVKLTIERYESNDASSNGNEFQRSTQGSNEGSEVCKHRSARGL